MSCESMLFALSLIFYQSLYNPLQACRGSILVLTLVVGPTGRLIKSSLRSRVRGTTSEKLLMRQMPRSYWSYRCVNSIPSMHALQSLHKL